MNLMGSSSCGVRLSAQRTFWSKSHLNMPFGLCMQFNPSCQAMMNGITPHSIAAANITSDAHSDHIRV